MNAMNYSYYIYAALGFTIICLCLSLLSAILEKQKTLNMLNKLNKLNNFNTFETLKAIQNSK